MAAQQPPPPTLSIVIPVYNERNTWRELVDRVAGVCLPSCRKQIILIDDGSSDGTCEQLRQFAQDLPAALEGISAEPVDVKVIFHDRNRGKGAALRTGFAAADGDFVIVQDADLEYDPQDYARLLEPLLAGRADAVYGSRFAGGRRGGSFKNYVANRFLTAISNLTTGLGLTDMETCYKVFRADVLRRLRLQQDRFGFEPEVTAKIARLAVRICEVPISYRGRTAGQGKKIGLIDGLNAIWCIVKYGLFARRRAKREVCLDTFDTFWH